MIKDTNIYAPLWVTLEHAGHTKAWLRQNGIHASTVNKLVKGENVTIDTLLHICKLLSCKLSDVIDISKG